MVVNNPDEGHDTITNQIILNKGLQIINDTDIKVANVIRMIEIETEAIQP